jgi:3-methyl-2-oxobutanoate hydroxymethyltransferase
MKVKLFAATTILILFFSIAHAQDAYERGYVIKNNDTTWCYVQKTLINQYFESITVKNNLTEGPSILLPQSIEELGGYKVQGRNESDAERIMQDALRLEKAGICALVLECIPAQLAKRITEALSIPTIGIGAGVNCDGQVLVLYDMLGLTPGKRPSFSKDFLVDMNSVNDAISAYVKEVKQCNFPTAEHSYS